MSTGPGDDAERREAVEEPPVRRRVLEHAMTDQEQAGDEQRQRPARHEEERLRVEPRHVPQPRREQHAVALLRFGGFEPVVDADRLRPARAVHRRHGIRTAGRRQVSLIAEVEERDGQR